MSQTDTGKTQETAAEGGKSPNEGPRPGSLVTQANGAGALRHGSTPGNKPGKGRPANWWREMCADGLYRARTVETMVGIISGDIAEVYYQDGVPVYGETKNSDRIKAAAFLAGYAFGQPKATLEVQGDGLAGKSLTLVEIIQMAVEMRPTVEELAKPAPQHPEVTDGR